MAKSLIILSLAVAIASAFTFKEAVPHQEKAAPTKPSFSAYNFDDGLDNPDITSDVSRFTAFSDLNFVNVSDHPLLAVLLRR